uniref:Asparagine--tRNA ligase N-terminal domain-containing protein n=1 Tax=Strigamia maritima TaxID=126957 RepID=T1IU84_STRMM
MSLYISEKSGDDISGDESKDKPLKTLLEVRSNPGKEPFPPFGVYKTDENDKGDWVAASQSQVKSGSGKNIKKRIMKQIEKDGQRHEKNMEDAKKIKMVKDPNLEKAKQIKIRVSVQTRGENVKIFGWVHHIRRQGNSNFQN